MDRSALTMFSLGYLVNRKGDYFEKNTFRAGAGQISLFKDKIILESLFNFNNLFKGVTPGLRLSINFKFMILCTVIVIIISSFSNKLK